MKEKMMTRIVPDSFKSKIMAFRLLLMSGSNAQQIGGRRKLATYESCYRMIDHMVSKNDNNMNNRRNPVLMFSFLIMFRHLYLWSTKKARYPIQMNSNMPVAHGASFGIVLKNLISPWLSGSTSGLAAQEQSTVKPYSWSYFLMVFMHQVGTWRNGIKQ